MVPSCFLDLDARVKRLVAALLVFEACMKTLL
jgi:hypothetical protein